MGSVSLVNDLAVAEQAQPVAPISTAALPTIFVVPVYNEEANLPRLFADLEARPWLFVDEASKVVFVDDGSDDGTAAVLAAYDGPIPVDVVTLDHNQGPGAAFRAGFEAVLETAPPDALVITLESDNTSDLDALPAMIAHARGGAELVLASVHGGGNMVNVSPLRRVLSKGAGAVVRVALGLDARTVSSFFRVYRSAVLRRGVERWGDALIQENGFACMAEVLAKLTAVGAKVEEVPVDLDASRRVGESKMDVLPTLLGYARLLVRGTRPARGTAAT